MKKLIILSCSMRSHETNKYQLLLDSSVNCILHRLSSMDSTDNVTITIPLMSNGLTALTEIVKSLPPKITIIPIPYGLNAKENRVCVGKTLSEYINIKDYDLVETQLEGVEGADVYHIYNTPVPECRRPYAEPAFFDLLENSKEAKTLVPTQSQIDMFPRGHAVELYTKYFNPKFADEMMERYYNVYLAHKLDGMIARDSLFFPFRVSDSCYRADLVEELGQQIVITDPNDSAGKTFNVPVLNISNIHKCKKTLYMTMLGLLRDRTDIRIPLYEDITKNYHISIVEMMYYCNDNIDFYCYNIPNKDKYII